MKKIISLMIGALLASSLGAAAFVFPGGAAIPVTSGLVTIPGQGLWIPSSTELSPIVGDTGTPNLGSITSTNASAKIALMGSIHQQGTAGCFSGTKNIQSIYFRTNNITAGGTPGTLRYSIQGMSTTAGPPAQPDGSILASGNAFSTEFISSVSSQAWRQAPNFGTVAPVTCGQKIAVVIDWSTAGSGSTFQISGGNLLHLPGWNGASIAVTSDGTAWTPNIWPGATADVLFAFDDGSYGAFVGATPFSLTTTAGSYNSASSPNEYGCSFTLPFSATISGMAMYVGFSNGNSPGAYTMELTDDAATPNVLASYNVDMHQQHQLTNNQGFGYATFSPVQLTANTKYHIGAKATSANNILLSVYTIGAAAQMEATPMGQNFLLSTRTNNGAWSTDIATTKPGCQILITQVQSG